MDDVPAIEVNVDELRLLAEPGLTKAEIERGYRLIRFDEGPEALRFQMAVPNEWGALPDGPTMPDASNPVTVLGRAQPADGSPAEITVFGARPGIEMHPADFLDAWMAQRGYGVRDTREFETAFGRVADVLATKTEADDTVFQSRLFALKDGDIIYILTGRAAAEAQPGRFADPFVIAIQTFALLEPTGRRFAEPFDWRAMANGYRALAPKAFEAMPAKAFTAMPGTVRLAAALPGTAPETSAPRAGMMMIEDLPTGQDHQAAGGLLGAMAGSAPVAVTPMAQSGLLGSATKGWTAQHGAARIGPVSYETIVLRRAGDAAILVLPAKDADLAGWARGRRAFEVMIETFGPIPSADGTSGNR